MLPARTTRSLNACQEPLTGSSASSDPMSGHAPHTRAEAVSPLPRVVPDRTLMQQTHVFSLTGQQTSGGPVSRRQIWQA